MKSTTMFVDYKIFPIRNIISESHQNLLRQEILALALGLITLMV